MLEPISKFKTFAFLEKTKNGSEVKAVYRDKDDDRMHIVFYRPQLDDYGIGLGYNPDDGTWNQGRYDFNTLEGAQTILHRDYNVERFEKPVVTDAIEETPVEENWGKKAWLLGKVMQAMNDEEAYYETGWLYIWPDGEEYEDCLLDFEDEEDYKELEKSFKRIYKAYHEGGLFNADEETEAEAHRWDNELGLEPIQNIKR